MNTANNDATGAQDESPGGLPREECERVIGHVEGFLDSPQTPTDECELRKSVADTDPELAQLEIEDLIRTIIRRSCCETAPETLRIRIRTQMTLWRSEG